MGAAAKYWTRASVMAWALGWALFACGAWAAPPPAEFFAKKPDLMGVKLSPSGQRLAVIKRVDGGRTALVVQNLDTGEAKLIARYEDADVENVWWATDDRLVFDAYQDGPVINPDRAGTFACDHDGSACRQLISWRIGNDEAGTRIISRTLPYGWYFHSTIDDGSEDVFVQRRDRDAVGDVEKVVLARVNTRTGQMRSLGRGMPAYAQRWLIDARGEPRVIQATRDGRSKIHWRDPKDDTWQLIGDFDALGNEGFEPVHLEPDGSLIVRSHQGRETSAYYSFDPAERRLNAQALVALQGFDLDGSVEFDSRSRKLVGVHFTADRPMSYWLDDRLQGLQRSLDVALPGRFNRIQCGRCESTNRFVVESSSDRQPGEYYLFDAKQASMQKLGSQRPWIDEATQGRRSYHRVATRDGLSMPVYVTHPPGVQAGVATPAVVLAHGGPWLRGSDLTWSAEAQFFASRGYRVIEPEFRGSTGYGFRHFELGFKQWGGAMQDDLADAVQWAGREGLVDTRRVCVMGASYGGYAALMAPIRHPGVFRCAIAFAAVTDLEFLYTVHWSDFSKQSKAYDLPALVGDRSKDASLLAAGSPVRRAAEIKLPVLLAHGGQDRRVPIEHATKFAAAARGGGVDIEVVTYADEGHGWYWTKHHTDYLNRAEKLLQRALDPAP